MRDRRLRAGNLGRGGRLRPRRRTTAVVPREEGDEDDGCSTAEQSRGPPVEARQRETRLRGRRGRGPLRLDPRVQLGDVDIAIEAEELGVGAEEGSRVHLGRQLAEPLTLEGCEELDADPGRFRRIAQLEPLARPRLSKRAAELEHRTCPSVDSHMVPRRRGGRKGRRKRSPAFQLGGRDVSLTRRRAFAAAPMPGR